MTTARSTESSATEQTYEWLRERARLDAEAIAERYAEEFGTITSREYDTSHPVDSLTGKPPLRRETVRTWQKASVDRKKQVVTQDADRQQNTATVITTQSQETAAADVKEKRGMNALQTTLFMLGIAAALAAATWLVFKIKQ